MTLLALIPARGGSKGIPRKNIRTFYGKPLIQWSIDAAMSAPSIDRVVVSTEDQEIAELAIAGGAEVPFLRPAELATDEVSGIAPVLHALAQLKEVSDLLLLQPTSPLRAVGDIEAIVKLRLQADCGSAVSLTPCSKHPAWMYCLAENDKLEALFVNESGHSRQQLPPAYALNGSLYLASRDFLIREQAFIAAGTIGYVMPPERSVDIDTPFDWQWAEFLMEQQH